MIHFRKAIGSEAKPLIGLYAESGCGKTTGALLIAKGFTGDMNAVGMIETEAGRGEAWADDPVLGGYNVLPLREEFSPTTYGNAIKAAEQAGLQCLIIDSASHEWEGIGGVLDMAAKNQAAGKKGQLVWQVPKMDHAREFMLRLTQTPIPLVIVCMRAKYFMEQVVVNGQKEWKRSEVLEPKQSEDILSEMFIHGWIDKKHIFHATKYTKDEYRPIIIDGEQLSVETGARLKAHVSKPKGGANEPLPGANAVPGGAHPINAQGLITADQVIVLADMLRENGLSTPSLLDKLGVKSLAFIPAADYDSVKKRIETVIEKRRTA